MKKQKETEETKELNFKLKRTLLLDTGYTFFHQPLPRNQQVIAATLHPDNKTLTVTIFINKFNPKSHKSHKSHKSPIHK